MPKLEVRMSDEEMTHAKAVAAAKGKTLSDVVRESLMLVEVGSVPVREPHPNAELLLEYLPQIVGVANNINQITRYIHEQGEVSPALHQTLSDQVGIMKKIIIDEMQR